MKASSKNSINFLKNPWTVFAYAVQPWRLQVGSMYILILLGNVCAYSVPYVLKLVADKMAEDHTALYFSDFFTPLLILVSLYVGSEIFFRIGHLLETYVVVRVFSRTTSALYENILARPTAYFEDQFSGELNRRLEQIRGSVQYFIEYLPWEIGWLLVASVMATILLGATNPLLVGIFLAWLFMFLCLSFFLLRWQYGRSKQVAKEHASLSGVLVDSLSNMSLVHAFSAQPYETSYYKKFMDRVVGAEKSERRLVIINKFHQGSSILLLGLSFIYTSVYLYLRGEMTVGDFIIVTAILSSFSGVVWMFGETVLRATRMYGGFKDAVDSLRTDVKTVLDGRFTLSLKESPIISFENVSFSYPKSADKVFENLSFSIRAGEKVGLVGKSGVGKSTIVKLLLRHYDPTKGKLLIDGQDVSLLTQDSLRKNISLVPQDTALFHRTLYENILYAKPTASKEEVIEASKRAHAHDFIEQYREGYETRVGERGVKLSGGQRQRIALARAMLKNSPILVLDEATSALDSESEEIVQKGLQELFGNRTVLAVAHRLSTLRVMDRIVVMDDGRIVEDGSPQELLVKESGIFKDMWEHQKSGFL